MQRGCVLFRRGKRYGAYRIKYRDATGRQIVETVGRVEEGTTREHAEALLRLRVAGIKQNPITRLRRMAEVEAAHQLRSHGEINQCLVAAVDLLRTLENLATRTNGR